MAHKCLSQGFPQGYFISLDVPCGGTPVNIYRTDCEREQYAIVLSLVYATDVFELEMKTLFSDSIACCVPLINISTKGKMLLLLYKACFMVIEYD